MLRVFLAFCFCFTALKAGESFLTAEEIALFYQQGYLLKRQALTHEEVEELVCDVDSAIDCFLEEIHQSSPPVEEDQLLYIRGSRASYRQHADGSVSITKINGCAGVEPKLQNILRSEKMVQTFFELLGTDQLEHLIAQIHPKLPGDGIAFPRHHDIQYRKSFDPNWQDILGNGSYAICILSVDPMTKENGGLWIDKNNYPTYRGEPEDLFWVDAEPGDLLFMHPHLFHGSGPNNSNRSRKTLLTGFCAFGANHMPYPGAEVNTVLTRDEHGHILISQAPWAAVPFTAPGSGH